MAHKVYAEEVERLVGEYNPGGEHGQVYAMDGKAVRGMRKKDEDGNDYLLSVYDVEHANVMPQVAVGARKMRSAKLRKSCRSWKFPKKWSPAMPCTPKED